MSAMGREPTVPHVRLADVRFKGSTTDLSSQQDILLIAVARNASTFVGIRRVISHDVEQVLNGGFVGL